jgi:predicted  nucleic acid-binding Zn-ribbon protein
LIEFSKPKPLSKIQEERERANLTPELLAALEAIAMLDVQNAELQAKVEALEAEIAALKGGGQA